MTFEVYKDTQGYFRWRLKASNGLKIADSAEGYVNRTHARDMVDKIKLHASTAQVEDRTVPARVVLPRRY